MWPDVTQSIVAFTFITWLLLKYKLFLACRISSADQRKVMSVDFGVESVMFVTACYLFDIKLKSKG